MAIFLISKVKFEIKELSQYTKERERGEASDSIII